MFSTRGEPAAPSGVLGSVAVPGAATSLTVAATDAVPATLSPRPRAVFAVAVGTVIVAEKPTAVELPLTTEVGMFVSETLTKTSFRKPPSNAQLYEVLALTAVAVGANAARPAAATATEAPAAREIRSEELRMK